MLKYLSTDAEYLKFKKVSVLRSNFEATLSLSLSLLTSLYGGESLLDFLTVGVSEFIVSCFVTPSLVILVPICQSNWFTI